MSARVFNPLVMSEMRRMMGRSNSDSGAPADVARVTRSLFGPVNHKEVQSFVDEQLAAIRSRECRKWGFDFTSETPLENARYQWERVSPEGNALGAFALGRLSGQQEEEQTTTTASTTVEERTTQVKPAAVKQSQITDFLKCRKRSLSAGDISLRKVGSAGDISSSKVGNSLATGPSKRKRSKTRQ